MHLSNSFSIDPEADWVRAHNAEVREVLEAFRADRPIRVPLLCNEWHGQHGFYADEIALDYREYYADPELMVRTQLEAARRRRELPIYDMVLAEVPDRWLLSVDFWPVVGPGWVGCELSYSRDCVPAHKRRELSKHECETLEMPDPANGGILESCLRFWTYMRGSYEGKLSFLGRPVGPVGHGVGTNGFFSLTLDLRGAAIMADMYEDPDFAHRFLLKVAGWCDTLERTWSGSGEAGLRPFPISDHGIDMLSPSTYERFIASVIAEMNRRRGTTPPDSLHHCGRGDHLFPILKKQYGLRSVSPVTFPLVDVARVRRELGEEVWVTALVEDSIVKRGPPERIREVVRALMRSGAKGRGRFALEVGDMLKGTPLEHRKALYEAVKEFGGY